MNTTEALKYAQRGWKVFPVHTIIDGRCTCGNDCSSPGKHPMVASWTESATTDPDRITSMFKYNNNANIGIATGNGLAVVDVDLDRGGSQSVKNIELPLTRMAMTGNGFHAYFSVLDSIPNSVNVLPGIDIRGDGGYVVAPPSTHANGKKYYWLNEKAEILRLPTAFVRKPRQNVSNNNFNLVESVGEGRRNHHIAKIAGKLIRAIPEKNLAFTLLRGYNSIICEPPLTTGEVMQVFRSVYAKHLKELVK